MLEQKIKQHDYLASQLQGLFGSYLLVTVADADKIYIITLQKHIKHII